MASSLPAPANPNVVIISAGIGIRYNHAASELCHQLRARSCTAAWYDMLNSLPRATRSLLRISHTQMATFLPRTLDSVISTQSHPFLLSILTLLERCSGNTLLKWIEKADLVVAVHPIAIQLLGSLKLKQHKHFYLSAYFCDSHICQFFLNNAIDQNLVITAPAQAACEQFGYSAAAISPVVGHEFYYDYSANKRAQIRYRLGLGNSGVILVCAGQHGASSAIRTVDDILEEMPEVSVIVLCKHDARLQEKLANRPRVVSLGWQNWVEMPLLMALSNVMVHNAGVMTVCEAIVMKITAITYRPLPGHGEANARAMELADLSFWARTRQVLGAMMRKYMDRPRNQYFHGRISAADEILSLYRKRS